MKKVTYSLLAFAVTALLPVAANALTVYHETFESFEAGADPDDAWNWTGDAATTNASTVEEYGGSMWRQMASFISSDSGTTGRYGYKVDITMSGENTSADEADYFVEFDVVNLEGDWDPVPLQLALLTANAEVGTGRYGYSFPSFEVAQADGVVHVKYQLNEHTANWWEGTGWDLTQTTWAYELGMVSTTVETGASFTQKILVDNFRIVYGSDEQPSGPNPLPANDDGTVGTLLANNKDVELTLTWNAGGDPDLTRLYPVNPVIAGHYIYLNTGAPEDPNLYLVDYVAQTHDADPALTDPYNEYGPIVLKESTEYTWQIEEAIIYGNGYSDAGDPNNIMSLEWKFVTTGAIPVITDPVNALVGEDGIAQFSVTGNQATTAYRWFKAGDPAIALEDVGIYSGTQTKTLTVTDPLASDEGDYYCIGFNGDPDNGGIASEPSATAKLWTRRLMSHFAFESLTGGVTTDTVGGFNMTMASDDEGTLAELTDGMAELAADMYGLSIANADETTTMYAIADDGFIAYKDITISAWVYWNGGTGWQRIIDCGNSTNEYIFISPGNGTNQADSAYLVSKVILM